MTEQTISYEEFISKLPADRRESVVEVWKVVRESMPDGYTEEVTPKFLSFKADKEWYVALASQKNYISLHLTPMYVFPELKAKVDGSGKKLKCGKGCINFKRVEELPLDVIAEIVSANDAESYKERMRQLRNERR
jgi:uncharacterized protein YdhG (YjbR/CyaY superfamily)